MSLLNDLTAITTPALTDILYCVQNSTDYKITIAQLLALMKVNIVIPLTQAAYDALPAADKNNGALYVITDAVITAADIEYSSGVSVADKIDEIDEKVIYDTFSDNIAISTAFGVCFRSGFMTVDLTSYGLTRPPKIFIQALSNQLYPIGVMLLETSISTTSFQFALVSPQQEGTARDFTINLMIVK